MLFPGGKTTTTKTKWIEYGSDGIDRAYVGVVHVPNRLEERKVLMLFNPVKPAAEMTAAELMACHVAMSDLDARATVRKVRDIYAELNRTMGEDQDG